MRLTYPVLAAMLAAGTAIAGPTATVPRVGCRSDGQQGPQPAQPVRLSPPRVPAALAERLAWYEGVDLGVLAPRGWHCFGFEGSNGSTLFVTPGRHGADLMRDGARLDGDAVVRGIRYGGTSGRFAVADAAAGLFPVARGFVSTIRREDVAAIEPIRPGPGDRILARTPRRVDYRTAKDRAGLGTTGEPLPPRGAPIRGYYALTAGVRPDLVTLRVRSAGTALAEAIVASSP